MDIQKLIDDVAQALSRYPNDGKVADYIPQLARVDPDHFGIAVADVDGRLFTTGDAEIPFSIQSVSKVFTLTLALGRVGDHLWKRVGREPSGSPFNSIVQLEAEHGIPRNPFINAGAIVIADVLLSGHQPKACIAEILHFLRELTGDFSIAIDPAVARSEQETGFRNRALANYMQSFKNITHPVEHTLGVYFHHCAIAMSCVQLARAGLYLANNGVNPTTGFRVVTRERARRINALMMTCGHYDASGDFAFRVGLPGKSGVGGGILAIVPGQAAIAVWSPRLNKNGNSLFGSLALEMIAEKTGWSTFG
ncbi:glutaminase [Methylovirgula sp. 4M-Z18]|uniref:glutaminase n=1 Tax=Methylovirgula sp. 4M-Z18 TaxID=2293567 RepID=UPI000E2FF0B1|nr:glutaminase [Methylovirgula sp. 4M-Z18]RFB80699.1 glutaminase [Methylovirgula sp. 4M-Z18]